MSDYDLFGDYEPEQPATLEEERPRKARPRQGGGIYDVVASLFMILTAGFLVWVALVFLNPLAAYNPFPPPIPSPTATLFALSTPTAAGDLPPTWTPSPTVTAGPSPTPQATATRTPTPGPTPTVFTSNVEATNTVAVFPFTLQDEAVTYTKNQNDEGCAWLSIAGQVFGLEDESLPGLAIHVTGEGFEQIEFTGSAPQYGASGYEVFLNSTPIVAEFVVRLLNTTGMPLSEPIVVRTLSSCDRNVAVVNFVQNHEFSR